MAPLLLGHETRQQRHRQGVLRVYVDLLSGGKVDGVRGGILFGDTVLLVLYLELNSCVCVFNRILIKKINCILVQSRPKKLNNSKGLRILEQNWYQSKDLFILNTSI